MSNNKFATEPQVEVVDQDYFENAERVNGQLAMLGFIAAIGSYIFTGQIIPGVFKVTWRLDSRIRRSHLTPRPFIPSGDA